MKKIIMLVIALSIVIPTSIFATSMFHRQSGDEMEVMESDIYYWESQGWQQTGDEDGPWYSKEPVYKFSDSCKVEVEDALKKQKQYYEDLIKVIEESQCL